MHKRILIVLVIIAVISCREKTPAIEEEDTGNPAVLTLTEEQVRNAGIETGAAQRQTLNSNLHVNGIVEVPPQNIVSVSFPLGGYLKDTRLLPGMHVNRGEVIGYIEDQSLVQLQQDYLSAVTRLQFLEQDFERQKTLNENKVSSDKIFQQVRSDYTTQKILVKALSEKLRLIDINPARLDESHISGTVPVYSPINGFVSKVNVNIGKYVNATDVLFELINPDDMHAALTIFEKDMPKVKIGQQVKVSFVDELSREYDCEVILVTRNIDDNRSGTVHCHFHTMPERLLPGMFLEAVIKVSDTAAITLPEDAVVRYGNTEYIVIETAPYQYELVAVKTGTRDAGRIAVSGSDRDLLTSKVVIKNAYAVLGQLKNTAEEE